MRSLTVVIALLSLSLLSAAKDDPEVNDFVKQHLNSIGTDQARATVKSRVVEGTLEFRFVNRAGENQDGKEVFISEENKSVALLKLPSPSYHGERFVCDGKRVEAAFIKPGVYSSFGSFVRTHPEVLTEGLFGGTLSTGWALSRIQQNNPKLQDRGNKKIDGKELRRLQYLPARHSDLEIFLYFDPQTAHHVMTTYSLTISPQLARAEVSNSKQDFTRYYLEERFDNFVETDGVQLPNRWTIQFTTDIPTGADRANGTWDGVPRGPEPPGMIAAKQGVMNTPNADPSAEAARSPVTKFDVRESVVHHNVTLDEKNFEIK